MEKNKIDFKDFEIIKEGQIIITGGSDIGGSPSTKPDFGNPNGPLPTVCDTLN
jgi:hypothetical protein